MGKGKVLTLLGRRGSWTARRGRQALLPTPRTLCPSLLRARLAGEPRLPGSSVSDDSLAEFSSGSRGSAARAKWKAGPMSCGGGGGRSPSGSRSRLMPPLKASMEAGTAEGAPGTGAGRARPPWLRPAGTRAQRLSGSPTGLPAPATTPRPRPPHGPPGAAGPGGRQQQRFLAPGFALRAALPPLGPQPPARPRLPIRGRFLRLGTAPAESVLKRQRAPPGSSSPCARGGGWGGPGWEGAGEEGASERASEGARAESSPELPAPPRPLCCPPSLLASPAPSSSAGTFPPPPRPLSPPHRPRRASPSFPGDTPRSPSAAQKKRVWPASPARFVPTSSPK